MHQYQFGNVCAPYSVALSAISLLSSLHSLYALAIWLTCTSLLCSFWNTQKIPCFVILRDVFLVINFWRDYRKHRGGHISPLAAYHPHNQMVLILDVARYHCHHVSHTHWFHMFTNRPKKKED